MEIREKFLVDAEPDEVADLLVEVETVASCVPGVEGVTEDADGSYRATLAVRVGPIKARFAGTLALDGSDAPRILRARGKGRDRSTNSQVSVEMEATLLEKDVGTEVTVVAQVDIRGRLGQFGAGLIQSTATEMIKAFATCLQGKLTERSTGAAGRADAGTPTSAAVPVGGDDDAGLAAPGSTGPEGSPPRTAKQPSILLLVARGLWRWLRDRLGRLLRRRSRT